MLVFVPLPVRVFTSPPGKDAAGKDAAGKDAAGKAAAGKDASSGLLPSTSAVNAWFALGLCSGCIRLGPGLRLRLRHRLRLGLRYRLRLRLRLRLRGEHLQVAFGGARGQGRAEMRARRRIHARAWRL